MMMDWTAYQQQLKANVGEIAKLSPETLRGYAGLSGAGQKTGHLDAKTRELIALGVAIAINAGAALVYSARVMDAYAALKPAG